MEEIVVLDEDCSVDGSGAIPIIKFSERVQEQIDRSMSKSVIVRLLGRTIGYKALLDRIIALWRPRGELQLVDLENNYYLVKYYCKALFRRIAMVVGKVVKVDYITQAGKRGKFARLAIMVDLNKPLKSCIGIGNFIQKLEYEGLQQICYTSGIYGHSKENCVATSSTT
ncbi:hypothetical protein F3Y22_tig00111772pilonHSYRG00087 [Hibiscus syriacus]|uniref:DUF4283 domain-containing protein n=1 Tax=Hibiscus syriacus TaxID=106335 RepID=A0A6A2XEH9_HIBSY|nr:hypothetical protein F3Y22_tig00111772pilonHSYRG00087 [Hibiscus syriacus]